MATISVRRLLTRLIRTTSLGSGIESTGQQVLVQLKGIAFVAVMAPVATIAILLVLKAAFGSLRVSDEDEVEGLDLSQHSESGYSGLGSGGIVEGLHAVYPAPHPIAAQRRMA